MREKARTFQDLAVWQKAHLIVLEIYELSKGFPKCERYGLTHKSGVQQYQFRPILPKASKRKAGWKKLDS